MKGLMHVTRSSICQAVRCWDWLFTFLYFLFLSTLHFEGHERQAAHTDHAQHRCRADGGNEAASMRIAEQYLTAFGGIAKAGNTLLLPTSANDPASMVAQALSIYNNVSKTPLANPR